MSGKLFLAGTETSPHFGGYMEGAVYSGLTAARNILNKKKIFNLAGNGTSVNTEESIYRMEKRLTSVTPLFNSQGST